MGTKGQLVGDWTVRPAARRRPEGSVGAGFSAGGQKSGDGWRGESRPDARLAGKVKPNHSVGKRFRAFWNCLVR